MRKLLVALVAFVLIVDAGERFACSAENGKSAGPAASAQVAPRKKIVAIGTVEPEEVVDVGAQVAGRIVSFGADPRAGGKPIDFGSAVEAGTVLAQIDSGMYTLRVERERAGCMHAEAELAKAKLSLEYADDQWQRAQDLKKNRAISDPDFALARFKYKAAKPSVTAAEAVLAQKMGALKQAEMELSYTTVRSPIQGVIIDRRANIGQMVSPAAGSPGIFLVGKIDKLQVWASVNEADIPQIHPQEPVHFTVCALPDKVFAGSVKQIRLNATMTQNVVTYTVVIAVTSPTGELLPYMTARVAFE